MDNLTKFFFEKMLKKLQFLKKLQQWQPCTINLDKSKSCPKFKKLQVSDLMIIDLTYLLCKQNININSNCIIQFLTFNCNAAMLDLLKQNIFLLRLQWLTF